MNKETFEVAIISSELELASKMDALTADWKEKIAELKIDEIEATEENKSKLTKLRVELNKALGVYAAELTKIRTLSLTPYDALKSQFDSKLKPELDGEVKKIQDKIAEITAIQLKENEDYAAEYLANKQKSVNFTKMTAYKDIPWKITVGSSKKSIRDTVDKHFEDVEKALVIIENHAYKDKLEALWIKHKLNIGDAMVDLQQQINSAEAMMKEKEQALKLQQAETERKRLEAEKRAEEAEARLAEIEAEEIKAEEVSAFTEVEGPAEINDYIFKMEMTDAELTALIEFLIDKDIYYELQDE